MGMYARRRITNGMVMTLSVAATGFGLLWLVLVLWTLLENGVAAITPALFSQMTPPPGSNAGERKSTRLNSSHGSISYAVCWLKTKITPPKITYTTESMLT